MGDFLCRSSCGEHFFLDREPLLQLSADKLDFAMNSNEHRMPLVSVQRIRNCGLLMPIGDIDSTPAPTRFRKH